MALNHPHKQNIVIRIKKVLGRLKQNFASPLLCYGCHCVGVLSWIVLPSAVALVISPSLPSALLGILSLATLPPIATPIIAIRVFSGGGFKAWQRYQGPLGARMLHACDAGLSWPKYVRRPRRKAHHKTRKVLKP